MGVSPSQILPREYQHLIAVESVLPREYQHLSCWPVLAKQARGPVWRPPNERINRFMRDHPGPAACIADYLTVRERMAFLHTHKISLSPKVLRLILFGGPSRETGFLSCNVSSNPHMAATKAYIKASLQSEVRYRGSFLCRVVSQRVVATALQRVLRAWMSNRLHKHRFDDVLSMVNRLLAVFRPTEEMWHAVMNSRGADGMTILTYALASDAELSTVRQLLELPCLDLGMPDKKFGMSPIHLAHQMRRDDLVEYFMSLVVF